MKHIQLYEAFQELPEGVAEITYERYQKLISAPSKFSEEDLATMESLARLADGKGTQAYTVFSIQKDEEGVAFRRSINNNYTLRTGIIQVAGGYHYYLSSYLDNLLPLAIDSLQVEIDWTEIR